MTEKIKFTMGFVALFLTAFANARSVELRVQSWITSPEGVERLSEQKVCSLDQQTPPESTVIRIDPAIECQSVLGFGGTFTDADIYNFMRMGKTARIKALRALFDPKEGAGWNLMRISFGSSDWDRNWNFYTYDDMPKGMKDDAQLSHFSVAEDERRGHFQLIREALRINPDLKIYAAVWGPPAWMKDNDKLISDGSLLPEYYDEYALYLVKAIQAYSKEGIQIYSVSPQNEPLCTDGRVTPQACIFDWKQMRDLAKVIRKAFAENNIGTELWVFDHNFVFAKGWVEPFIADSANRKLIDGVCWHDYGGDIEEMGRLSRKYADVPMYLTERSLYSIDGLSRILRILRNGARCHTHWVTISDEYGGPYQWGGGSEQNTTPGNEMGLSALYNLRNAADTWCKTPGYFTYAQLARFVHRNARYIQSTHTGNELVNAAFRNPDGSIVVVVSNTTAENQRFTIEQAGFRTTVELPARSAGTYVMEPLAAACSVVQTGAACEEKAGVFYVRKRMGSVLPFGCEVKSLAVVGPLADWKCINTPESKTPVSVLDEIKAAVPLSAKILYDMGCNVNDEKTPIYDVALAAALEADAVVVVLGDNRFGLSVDGQLPGKQEEFVKWMMRTGKPVVVLLINKSASKSAWLWEHALTVIEAVLPGNSSGNELEGLLFN